MGLWGGTGSFKIIVSAIITAFEADLLTSGHACCLKVSKSAEGKFFQCAVVLPI